MEKEFTRAQLAQFIDHTVLAPTTSKEDLIFLCSEAVEYGFYSVCVPPHYVQLARKYMDKQGSKARLVGTVIGFPLGYQRPSVKEEEAKRALGEGAQELDMVINLCALKNNEYAVIVREIQALVRLNVVLKVILETCYLDNEEIAYLCALAKEEGAQFVKTSTGFGPKGAQKEHVDLMRGVVGPDLGVKASGGIRDLKTAKSMIAAGANRLGISASVKILKELKG